MKKLLLLVELAVLLVSGAGALLQAQPAPTTTAPDCIFYFNLLQSGGATQSFPTGSGYINLPAPNATPGTGGVCTTWTLNYVTINVTTTITVELQSANATMNQVTAGSFGAYAGAVSVGANPSVTLTGADAAFTNGAVATPFIRIQVRDFVDAGGRVWGVVYGYKAGFTGGGAIPGSGCAGTVGTPCIVAGPVAAGSAVGASGPVQVSGSDGTNVRRIFTDTTGRTQVVGAAADGAAVAGNPVLMGGQDGTNAQSLLTDTSGRPNVVGAAANGAAPAGNPLFLADLGSGATGGLLHTKIGCDQSAAVTFTAASGSVQVIALTAAQSIYICDVMFASDTVTNITLEYGTGSACGTGTVVLGGVFQNVLTMALSFSAALRTIAAQAFCIVSSATATIGGTVTYAKF